MGFVKKWFPKPKPAPPPPPPAAPTPIPTTPVASVPSTAFTIGGYGGSTIMTGSMGIEEEANVAQTVLGGGKGKKKLGVYA